MNGLQAAARYGCTHAAPASCPWCDNPRGEEYREPARSVYPGPDFPAAMVDVGPAPMPLWEALDKLMPGCWGTPGGAE